MPAIPASRVNSQIPRRKKAKFPFPYHHSCGSCGHKWGSKVEKPRECPFCRSKRWAKSVAVVDNGQRL